MRTLCAFLLLVVSASAKGPVVRVYTDVGAGSGTLIASEETYAQVLTAFHVVDDAATITVRFADGARYAATVQKVDATWDLALLVIKPVQHRAAALADRAPDVGEAVSIGRYGPHGGYEHDPGIVSEIRVSPGVGFVLGWFVIDDAEGRPGDSGGPVWDGNGRIVGVLWGSRSNQTIACDLQRVRKFLNER